MNCNGSDANWQQNGVQTNEWPTRRALCWQTLISHAAKAVKWHQFGPLFSLQVWNPRVLHESICLFVVRVHALFTGFSWCSEHTEFKIKKCCTAYDSGDGIRQMTHNNLFTFFLIAHCLQLTCVLMFKPRDCWQIQVSITQISQMQNYLSNIHEK